ncbi:hypothetical protein [Rhizobium sp. Leaf341]|uniref:hypothetical protein n=1 Tax=Rhizobium sp. Leaf341 TaxID=1736344 RepID=UPI000B29F02B|nr:hypothetical protein [Rhizobium sp. Leaf341]
MSAVELLKSEHFPDRRLYRRIGKSLPSRVETRGWTSVGIFEEAALPAWVRTNLDGRDFAAFEWSVETIE